MGQSPDFYSSYIAFKRWEADENLNRPEDYAALFALSRRPHPARLLDIGSGRGGLLDWAKSHGVETSGTEIIHELAQRSESRGHRMLDPALMEAAGPFDLVTAIDVLEHLTPDEIHAVLVKIHGLIAPNGRFLARFPNGQSPFSGMYQHGDLTHVRHLSPGSLRQIAETCQLEMVGAYNPRSMPPGLRGLKRRAAYFVRDAIEITLGYAYFGYRVPMDPNVVVVLKPRGEN